MFSTTGANAPDGFAFGVNDGVGVYELGRGFYSLLPNAVKLIVKSVECEAWGNGGEALKLTGYFSTQQESPVVVSTSGFTVGDRKSKILSW